LKGKGNLPKRAEPLTDTEINTLFDKELLGKKTPSSLLNTKWYLNTLHFEIRGRGEEHRELKWTDIELRRDTNSNLDYVEFNERQTKTRTGEDARNVRDSKPCAYETPANKSSLPSRNV
jgi:hypothetical protein